MKRNRVHFYCILIAFLLILTPLHSEAKVKAPKKECHAYVVMDAGSGQVLFGQDEDKMIYPASTAKVMTAIVCVENGNMNKKVKTQYDVVYGTTLGTYCLGIGANVTYTCKDLLAMSLISSAADATDSLAVAVFGSKEACVEAMNKKCQELGLVGTHFDNPVGSDIGAGFNETYATATEMAKIVRYAMTKPIIRDLVRRSSYSVKDIQANTTNRFIRGTAYYDSSKYKVIGTKSGTTNAAGHVYIATAMDKEGHEVICAFFGNVSTESTFASIRRLFDYTFAQYKKGKLTLTPSNYDVRCADDFGDLYSKYALLNCYPGDSDGLFHPNFGITRSELAKMVRGVDNLSGNLALKQFVLGNKKGKVKSSDLAKMVQALYPSHMSKENVDAILEGCSHTEFLTEEEREAFAIYIQNNLAPNEFCKNACQVITRKQAVYFADHLKEYQNIYASTNYMPAAVGLTSEQAGDMMMPANIPTLNEVWLSKMDAYHAQKEEERAQRAAKKAEEEAAKAAAEAATAEEVTATEATTEAAPAK
ncbi:MAG: serine hydrolase [Eubacteriales bacterium]|nr:serine hydrolase [Eubacteriales bacterium]